LDYPEETRQNNPYYSRKLKADMFIDDCALGGLPDWGTIYRMISEKKKWHDLIDEAAAGSGLSTASASSQTAKKRWWQF
jgi:hypothetical protein